MTLADLGSATGARPPNGIQFFHFRIRFHRKVPASEVGAPQREILDPPLDETHTELLINISKMMKKKNKDCTYYYTERLALKELSRTWAYRHVYTHLLLVNDYIKNNTHKPERVNV